MPRNLRVVAALAVVVAVAACTDAPSSAARHTSEQRGALAFAPVFAKSAQFAAAHADDFGITFDHVHIIITRKPSTVIKDTIIPFTPSMADVTLDINVTTQIDGEVFIVSMDYLSGAAVVFHGGGSVAAHAPDTPAPAQTITLQYTGPGSNVSRIAIAPKTVSLISPATVGFTVTAFDASNAPAPSGPIKWTSSDPTVATINQNGATGTLTPTGKRGTVVVTAQSTTNVTDAATTTITLPASTIAVVSGAGQTGKVGSTLAAPGIVRVSASDGVGVPGVIVNFAAPTGGKVGSASVTTDANGLASTSLTLGGTVGPQSFAAVALGFSTSIGATANVGDPATAVAVSGGGQKDTVGRTLKAPLVVKVTDAFGNPVPGVAVAWSRSGSGALGASSSTTASDGTASTTYTLGATAATETITATVVGVSTGATFSEQAVAGLASSIAIASGAGQTGRLRGGLPAPLVVLVTDVSGNPVVGATVTWSATNGTVASATTTTDASGTSSNTMTLGTAVGSASATASIGAKSVTFAETVAPGIVSRAQFRVSPSSGIVGSPLTPAVQVALTDADGNLVPAANNVTIAIGTNPGGGTLGGTLTKAAVAGVATFSDLTISAAGTGYTLVAISSGTPGATSTPFNVTGGVSATRTWGGLTSSDWFNAANWVGGVVPTAVDNVVIPSGEIYTPTLTASASIKNLTISDAMNLNTSSFDLTISGSVNAGENGIIATTGHTILTGIAATASGPLGNVRVRGTITFASFTSMTSLTMSDAGASVSMGDVEVDIDGDAVITAGTFTVSGDTYVGVENLTIGGIGSTALFVQRSGTIEVFANATFDGASTATTITGGEMFIEGNFVQRSDVSAASFRASGTHTTTFEGSTTHTVTFANADASWFQDLYIEGSNVVTFLSPVTVAKGSLSTGDGSPRLSGTGNTLIVGGLDIDGAIFDNLLLSVNPGPIDEFDNVTFTHYSPDVTPLSIVHPGIDGSFEFFNINFLVTPGLGSYLSVTDAAPADGNVLQIDLFDTTPSDGSAHTSTSGGAIVNWNDSFGGDESRRSVKARKAAKATKATKATKAMAAKTAKAARRPPPKHKR